MALSVKDILKPLEAEDVIELFLDLAKGIGLPVNAWQAGEPFRAILDIVGQGTVTIWNGGILPLLGAIFLDYASGDVLTFACAQIYGTFRYSSAFAGGPATLTNTDLVQFYSFNPGDVRITSNITKKTYKNTTSGVLPPWDGVSAYPTVVLDFLADEAGSDSTVPAGTFQLISSQPGLTIVSSVEWVGQDEEKDEDLRERARAQASINSLNTPKSKCEFICKSTKRADGTYIPINRVKIPVPPGDGTVDVYVASISGAVSSPDIALVQAAIEEQAEGLCETITVISATPITVPVTATMYVYNDAGLSNNAVQKAGDVALREYFQRIPIGGDILTDLQTNGTVFKAAVTSILQSYIDNSNLYFVEVANLDTANNLPDLDLNFNEVAVIGQVTLSVVRVKRP